MIVLVALAVVIVLPVALMTASAFLLCPRDPVDQLLTESKPWGCSRCVGEWDDLAAYFAHNCRPALANASGDRGTATASLARSEGPDFIAAGERPPARVIPPHARSGPSTSQTKGR